MNFNSKTNSVLAMSSQVHKAPGKTSTNTFLRSWVWKREHRPDRDRFDKPYNHKVKIHEFVHELVIYQQPFKTTGFASTVWDSAIVLSKYLEKWPAIVKGKTCIELGAGCGLPGIVAGTLEASKVTLTDFPENLALLEKNIAKNKLEKIVSARPLVWGSRSNGMLKPFDVVIATDIMYYVEAVDLLLGTLKCLSNSETLVLIAYGRNRRAEEVFLQKAVNNFYVRQISSDELDEVYQCIDVEVLELKLKSK